MKTPDPDKGRQLVHLVYSLNLDGTERKLGIEEKLSIMKLSSRLAPEVLRREENHDIPSIYFVIGFFLGDGSLGFTFQEGSNNWFSVKPFFSIGQKWNEQNVHLLSLVAITLGVKYKDNGLAKDTAMLIVSGDLVYYKIMPTLGRYQDYLY